MPSMHLSQGWRSAYVFFLVQRTEIVDELHATSIYPNEGASHRKYVNAGKITFILLPEFPCECYLLKESWVVTPTTQLPAAVYNWTRVSNVLYMHHTHVTMYAEYCDRMFSE